MKPLTMGVTMLGTAEVVMLAGGELRPAGGENKTKQKKVTGSHSMYKTMYKQAYFP